jgi:hypothetical protein
MRRPVNIRQPINCEPCRKRKIRCSRNGVPCDTCERRGCSSRCTYLRPGDSGSAQLRTDGPAPISSGPNNAELLNRINSLETIMQRHMGAQYLNNGQNPSRGSSAVMPTTEQDDPSRREPPSPESFTTSPRAVGTLNISETGDVQYEPRSSQWMSVIANPSIQASINCITDGVEYDLGAFPFEASGVTTRKDLLAVLPPTRQCNQLKDVYFKVFSPVHKSRAASSSTSPMLTPA